MAALPAAILLHPNEGCLKIAKVLSGRGVRVVTLAPPSARFFARSRHVEGVAVPALPAGADEWVARLEALALEGPGVLLSGSDAATEFIIRQRDRLPPGLHSFEAAGGDAHVALMGKDTSYEVARRAGVRVPATVHVRTREDLDGVEARAALPCIVKPNLSHDGKRVGGHRTCLVEDPIELRSRCEAGLRDGIAMLVSEWIPGPEPLLEAAVSVRAADGSYSLEYARRKRRQWPPGVGVGTLHESAHLPDTLGLARRILEEAGYTGVSIVEFKRDPRSGEPVLIEVNVRVPMGFGLGDACGADASWRLYATLAGLPLGAQPRPRAGVKALIPQFDVRAVSAQVRSGDLTLREAARSYRGVGDAGVLDLRDPLPAATLLLDRLRAVRSRGGGLR